MCGSCISSSHRGTSPRLIFASINANGLLLERARCARLMSSPELSPGHIWWEPCQHCQLTVCMFCSLARYKYNWFHVFFPSLSLSFFAGKSLKYFCHLTCYPWRAQVVGKGGFKTKSCAARRSVTATAAKASLLVGLVIFGMRWVANPKQNKYLKICFLTGASSEVCVWARRGEELNMKMKTLVQLKETAVEILILLLLLLRPPESR